MFVVISVRVRARSTRVVCVTAFCLVFRSVDRLFVCCMCVWLALCLHDSLAACGGV